MQIKKPFLCQIDHALMIALMQGISSSGLAIGL